MIPSPFLSIQKFCQAEEEWSWFYLRKKRFARLVWTAVLPGLFVDLKWNLPFWIHPSNNGKIATMFRGIPQDIATWTLPLPKRTFRTAGKYSRELWMGWSQSAINGYNSGRMHLWGSWSVRYPPEVQYNHWKVTFPIGKSSSNHHFSGSTDVYCMLNFGGVAPWNSDNPPKGSIFQGKELLGTLGTFWLMVN